MSEQTANPYLAWNGREWLGYNGSAWIVVDPAPKWDGRDWLFWDGSQFRAIQPQPAGGPYTRTPQPESTTVAAPAPTLKAPAAVAAPSAPVTSQYYDEDPLAQHADAEASLVANRLADHPRFAATVVPAAATVAPSPAPTPPVAEMPTAVALATTTVREVPLDLPPPDEFARVPDGAAPPPPPDSDAALSAAALGPAAMTLGVLGILAALVPFVFFIAITLGVIGLVLALMARKRLRAAAHPNHRLVSAATIVSVVAIAGGLVGAYLVFFVISSNDQPVSNPQISSSPLPGSSTDTGSTAAPTQPAG